MSLEALYKKEPVGPPLELKPIIFKQGVTQNEHSLADRIKERARIISLEHTSASKPRVQISKSIEYPPGFVPRVCLLESHFLGVWKYPENSDTCAICRMPLAALCVNCEGMPHDPQKCLVEWGTCKHAYHGHCIEKWVQQRNACPICQQLWTRVYQESPLE